MAEIVKIMNQGMELDRIRMVDSTGVVREISAVYKGSSLIWPNVTLTSVSFKDTSGNSLLPPVSDVVLGSRLCDLELYKSMLAYESAHPEGFWALNDTGTHVTGSEIITDNIAFIFRNVLILTISGVATDLSSLDSATAVRQVTVPSGTSWKTVKSENTWITDQLTSFNSLDDINEYAWMLQPDTELYDSYVFDTSSEIVFSSSIPDVLVVFVLTLFTKYIVAQTTVTAGYPIPYSVLETVRSFFRSHSTDNTYLSAAMPDGSIFYEDSENRDIIVKKGMSDIPVSEHPISFYLSYTYLDGSTYLDGPYTESATLRTGTKYSDKPTEHWTYGFTVKETGVELSDGGEYTFDKNDADTTSGFTNTVTTKYISLTQTAAWKYRTVTLYNPYDDTTETVEVLSGEAYSLPERYSNSQPDSNYATCTWKDEDKVVHAVGENITIDADTTFTLVLSTVYYTTNVYVDAEKSKLLESLVCTYGGSVTPSTPSDKIADEYGGTGYTFSEWEGGVLSNITSNQDIYATYKQI